LDRLILNLSNLPAFDLVVEPIDNALVRVPF
jgi:hypothetical protein